MGRWWLARGALQTMRKKYCDVLCSGKNPVRWKSGLTRWVRKWGLQKVAWGKTINYYFKKTRLDSEGNKKTLKIVEKESIGLSHKWHEGSRKRIPSLDKGWLFINRDKDLKRGMGVQHMYWLWHLWAHRFISSGLQTKDWIISKIPLNSTQVLIILVILFSNL